MSESFIMRSDEYKSHQFHYARSIIPPFDDISVPTPSSVAPRPNCEMFRHNIFVFFFCGCGSGRTHCSFAFFFWTLFLCVIARRYICGTTTMNVPYFLYRLDRVHDDRCERATNRARERDRGRERKIENISKQWESYERNGKLDKNNSGHGIFFLLLYYIARRASVDGGVRARPQIKFILNANDVRAHDFTFHPKRKTNRFEILFARTTRSQRRRPYRICVV